MAALKALEGQWITLIVGGLDRGLDWTAHLDQIRAVTPGAVIAIPDNGPRILAEMRQFGLAPDKGLHLENDLGQAVARALEITPRGGLVLLSPGAPSFPQFRDFAHRGETFAALCGFESATVPPSGEQA